jgi:hypothetical protein
VNVSRPAGVVTRKDGFKVDNTIFVTRLDTSQPGSVDIVLIRRVTVSSGNDA